MSENALVFSAYEMALTAYSRNIGSITRLGNPGHAHLIGTRAPEYQPTIDQRAIVA